MCAVMGSYGNSLTVSISNFLCGPDTKIEDIRFVVLVELYNISKIDLDWIIHYGVDFLKTLKTFEKIPKNCRFFVK